MDKTIADEIAWLEKERGVAIDALRHAVYRRDLDAMRRYNRRVIHAEFRASFLRGTLPSDSNVRKVLLSPLPPLLTPPPAAE